MLLLILESTESFLTIYMIILFQPMSQLLVATLIVMIMILISSVAMSLLLIAFRILSLPLTLLMSGGNHTVDTAR